MEHDPKPYVQVVIDGVEAIVHDPEGRYDIDQFDRYATFEQARDAALTCIEYALDEADYEDEAHRAGLEAMLGLLERADSFEALDGHPEYRRLIERLTPAWTVAA